MRQSLLLFFVLAAFSSRAQIGNFKVSLAPNLTVIPSVTETVTGTPVSGTGSITSVPVGAIRKSFKSKLGVALAFQGDYKFTSRFFISTGLGLDLFRYQRTFDVTALQLEDNVTINETVYGGYVIGTYYGGTRTSDVAVKPLSVSDQSGNTSLLFAQVPVLAGTSFFHEKLRISAGTAFKFLLASSETESYYDYSSGQVKDRKVHETGHFESFNASGIINVSYSITKYFAVTANGTKSFTSLYAADQSAKSTKLNAFSLGAQFIIR